MDKIPYKDAKAHGFTRYFTGKTCRFGHVAERHVSSRHCVVCEVERARKQRLAAPEKAKAASRKYQKANRTKVRERCRKWREANPDKMKAALDRYDAEHPGRTSAWAKANPGKANARTAKRRAARIQRTPAWADLEAIKFFYECCPVGCEVDHIIPLQGKNVSGLHVAENLQWLPAEDNKRKGDSFEPYSVTF